MPQSATTALPWAQLILTTINIIVMAYAFLKFLKKPRDTIEQRLGVLEVEVKEIKVSLLQGNDRFREQDDTNEVLIHSVLALIEFEIQYCLTEHKDLSRDLERAKEDLHNYLSKR